MEAHRGGQATLQVQSVLAKLSLCRTTALGGHWYRCDDCSGLTKLHNSCGDRHCPGCSGGKRQDFHDRAGQLLIEGVEYCQVVFTLPAILSELALANRHALAGLLFSSAWKALRGTIEEEQDYDPAAVMVLHTWNQKLQSHWHVHALVPCGGPALGGSESWKTASDPRPGRSETQRCSYLVDAINLRTAYRKSAINRLERLRREGKLKLGGSLAYLREDAAWEAMIDDLKKVEWVSYIEPPPGDSSRPEHVIGYLTRYLTGGPISDHRITATDEETVTLLAREGRTVGGEELQVPLTLPRAEFVRRWCLHIQPDQLTKTRYFGGWSNSRKEEYLERCAKLLDAADIEAEREISFDPEELSEPEEREPLVCEHCGSKRLRLIREVDKPSWKDVLGRHSQACPPWYAASRELDDREFWDAAMGEGFSDWYDEYLKEAAEGARGPGHPATPGPASQPPLPGLSLAETGTLTALSL